MPMLLLFTVFLPLLGAAVLFATPRADVKAARSIALGTALATLGLTAILVLAFQVGVAGPQFAVGGDGGPYGWSWMEPLGVRFALGLDGVSLWLFALTSLLMITAIFASWESITDRPASHYAFILSLETGLLGLFASLDVILFYIFFEFTLIPLFFLIGLWGGPERRRASIYFFLYTLAGSVLTLLGVVALVAVHYQHTEPHVFTFSIPELTAGLANLQWDQWTQDWAMEHRWWQTPQVLIFLLLIAGFAIKVPMFPFHTWLPLAHVEAPTAGSILLAGVLLKVGSYGILRFCIGMTPVGGRVLFPLLATLAVAGIIYGALAALAQTDVKRLIAYSSVSHMGFIVLGLFAMNATGIDGATIQMINHGLTTGALFACVGVIYERYHTREMSEMGGLWQRLPLFAFFFIFSSMGSAALPGLNGFVGEFPILVGAFSKSPLAATLATTGMILGAFYLLWMLQRVLFGPLKEPHAHGHGHDNDAHAAVRPVGWHEIAGLTPLLVLIVFMGVYPSPFFNRIQPSVRTITEHLDKLELYESGVERSLTDPYFPRPKRQIPQTKSAARRVESPTTAAVLTSLPTASPSTLAETKGRPR